MRLISGILQFMPLPWLPVLANIVLPEFWTKYWLIWQYGLQPAIPVPGVLNWHSTVQHCVILRSQLQSLTSDQPYNVATRSWSFLSDVVCTELLLHWPGPLGCKSTQVEPGVLWQVWMWMWDGPDIVTYRKWVSKPASCILWNLFLNCLQTSYKLVTSWRWSTETSLPTMMQLTRRKEQRWKYSWNENWWFLIPRPIPYYLYNLTTLDSLKMVLNPNYNERVKLLHSQSYSVESLSESPADQL